MKKVGYKIKETPVCGKCVEKKIENVCKSKKLNDTEKFKKCVDLMGEYLLIEHYDRASYETWKTYHKTFCVNGKKDYQKYKECFDFVSDNILMVNSVQFQANIKNLENVDTDKLTLSERLIYNEIKKCIEKFFTKDFDYKLEVLRIDNSAAYEKTSKSILDDIIANYKEKNILKKDLYKINAVEEFGQNF